jgi:transcriptional regulator with GAF, ATPase, and Fis domain
VLIQGESGTGKELIARAVHELSARRDKPMIRLNCGALPPTLVQSELFGHERGAFTGALARRRGRFELADGGTLFLDEVAELPLETQATLLRVLQEGEFERVGGTETVRVDVRVIAATHQDLAHMVESGRFRADLYYRLNVFPMRLPPLRERRRDIPELVESCLVRLSKRLGRELTGVTDESMQRLMRYSFPGNVRELHNVLERAAILASGPRVEVDALVEPSRAASLAPHGAPLGAPGLDADGGMRLEAKERSHITAVLRATGWKIAGDDGAAAALGLHPNTLRSRMKRLGIPTRSDNRRAASF